MKEGFYLSPDGMEIVEVVITVPFFNIGFLVKFYGRTDVVSDLVISDVRKWEYLGC